MKRLSFVGAALSLLALCGCKSVPSADAVYMISSASGAATALVMNETKLSCEKREVIRDIVKEVRECTPEVGQTLEAAWTPIAKEHVALLVEMGKIDSASGVLIMAGFKTVMVGVNLIETRYPQVRTARDLTDSAIWGFSDGFLAKFDVKCDDSLAKPLSAACLGIDRDVVTEVRKAAIRNNIR